MCSARVSFYNATALPHPSGTVFNMVWRTPVLQMTVFIMPVRRLIQTEGFFNMVWRTHVLQMTVFIMPVWGLIQTEQFLIWFGDHMFSK